VTARRPHFERAFARALTVALFLHLPFVPLSIFEWVRLALVGGAGDYDDRDAEAIIPIDMDLLARDPEPVAAPPAEPPPAAPLSGEGAPDAGPVRAHPKKPPEPAETPDAGPRPLADPVSAAGGAGKIAAKDPNVQILLAGSVLRRHEIGAWAGRMLLMIPEWRGFFEGSPINPIRDLDHLLITAPRFKGDSSKLVAVMDYTVSAAAARDALDQVLHRTGGVWIEDAPVPAARARVGGALRILAQIPERRLLVILPGDATAELERLKKSKPFRRSAEGAVVSLLTPSRPFARFFPMPESIKWLRLALTPTADEGADLALDAGDASAEEAQAHAVFLSREIEARRKVSVLGLASVEIVGPVVFTAEGSVIRARTHVPAEKLRMIMAFVEQSARERFGAVPPRIP
jgi:hypothetical protein